MPDSDSHVTQYNLPCPNCGSSDAGRLYSDGHFHCFSCAHHTNAGGGVSESNTCEEKPKRRAKNALILDGSCVSLKKRAITARTCEHWRYQTGTFKDKSCQIANYCDDKGRVVAQKIRLPGKDFTWTGDPKKTGLYGQWLWRDGGKKLVITEGELDALSVSQLQDNKWPVVSVPNGAQGARKDLAKSIQWLEQFEEVVFMFDNDDPGNAAAIECAQLLTPGKAKIAHLPLKDASDMLQAGRGREVIDAIWGAKTYRPDGVVTLGDIIADALKPEVPGASLPWKTLTDLIYGVRTKEIHIFGAGVGVGKTDVFTQLIAHFITHHKERVGVIYLEQNPTETAKRIAGKVAGKPFHVPGATPPGELESTLRNLEKDGRLVFYNHFGSQDWETIKGLIKYMVVGLGCKRIFLDHLTALTAHEEDERRALDSIMAEQGALVQELDFTLFEISHLTTPEGKSHEEGGRVMEKHFTGSRAIMRWANFMYGLERNKQAEDEIERRTTTFRILKDRNTGRGTGATFKLLYDFDNGLLTETEDNPFPPEDEADDKTSDI